MVKYLLSIVAFALTFNAYAQSDPMDIFGDQEGIYNQYHLPPQEDDDKTPERLVNEALNLLADDRPVDARSKLLVALKKDPKSYRAHMVLANYYLSSVGHFRLALRYNLRAIELFTEQFGPPPYSDFLTRFNHGYLLRLLSQVRLNLDDYEGALKELDTFKELGYYDESYAGNRAWVLMKLGRTEEAIRVAQFGYNNLTRNTERGHILNMLGILYSMTQRRTDSIKVFNDAIKLELSRGSEGQAATPLNNVGEVYRETFLESKAEESFNQALRLPDACEHVLPALNQTFLSLEELKPAKASDAMSTFAKCIAQFPLRNNEEHRALVQLAHGRINLISGRVDAAIADFENALSGTQWFGKIGTQEEDFKLAAVTSLADALDAKSFQLVSSPGLTLREKVSNYVESKLLHSKAWWIRRSAAIMAIEKLHDFEDIYVRHSDSFILYATLGSFLSQWPTGALQKRIGVEVSKDNRSMAMPYYQAYLAEHAYRRGDIDVGNQLSKNVLPVLRHKEDALLHAHLLATKIQASGENPTVRRQNERKLFLLWRPFIRNFGLHVAVRGGSNARILRALFEDSPFEFPEDSSSPFSITIEESADRLETTLTFSSDLGTPGTIRVKSPDRKEAARKLVEAVFTEER